MPVERRCQANGEAQRMKRQCLSEDRGLMYGTWLGAVAFS